MSIVNKEIVLKGFNGGTDATDDLIIWVVGEESEIDRITKKLGGKVMESSQIDLGTGGTVSFSEGKYDGLDFDLPKDEASFLLRVESLLASSINSIENLKNTLTRRGYKVETTNGYIKFVGADTAKGVMDIENTLKSFEDENTPLGELLHDMGLDIQVYDDRLCAELRV